MSRKVVNENAAIPAALAEPWLAMQCSIIAGVTQAVLALEPPQEADARAAACWPAGSQCTDDLAATLSAAAGRRRAVIRTGVPDPARAQTCDLVALPLLVDGDLAGVVALRLASRGSEELGSAMQLLKWGLGWLELLARQQAGAVSDGVATLIGLIATCVGQRGFQAAANAVVTELAATLRCENVCVGVVERGRVRLAAVSNSAWFTKNTTLSGRIEYAMAEAIDQRATLVIPADDERAICITQAHEALAAQHGGGAVCTVPLVSDGELTGALMLQRSAGECFDPQTVALCEYLGAVAGPMLELRRRDDRSLLRKNLDALRAGLARLFGAGHLTTKLAAITVLAMLTFLALADGRYRVAATATIEGSVQRAVIAPSDGYVAEATARPGDVVRAGEPLGSLDRKALELEKTKWQGKAEQLSREYRNALAGHDRVQANILKAQIDQADAELELVAEQLSRVALVAPFDGVVVAGDLSQSLGSPVARGDVLFQVAPLDAYRVILHVDEHEIARLAAGQRGHLVLPALPGEHLPFVVERITPVATARDGGNHFVVEARMDEAPASLRPGMEGVAKIDIDRRSLLWIWTHDLVDRVGLWLWSWWR